MRLQHFSLALLAMCAAIVTGCAAERDYYPSAATLQFPLSEARSADVLAHIVGVRPLRGDGEKRLHVRLRVTNRTSQPVEITPESLELVTGDLQNFPAPVLDETPVVVPPENARTFVAQFPLPANVKPGDDNLQHLHLTVTLESGDASISRAVTFQQIRPGDYHHRRSPFQIGVGVGVHRHF